MLIRILLIVAGALSLVLVPWVFKPIDRRTVSWAAAWARTTIIVLYFIGFTVVLPSLVIKSSVIAALPRTAQQLIGAGLWTVALVIGLWGLWWAPRSERV
jgi:ABC-type Na+ efflux pump permease subunit